MDSDQFSPRLVKEFLEHPVWRHFAATVAERIAAGHLILEGGIDPVNGGPLDLAGIKFFQGSLKEDRYLLWFLEDLEQELESEKEEGE